MANNGCVATQLNTHSHFEESLQRDMDLIRSKVAEMAGLSERALKASLQALVERNRQLAYSVILRDQYIDELETELNRLCLEFLVRQQPVAGHLRFVFTAIQINKELERIGDYAESIARQVLAVSALEPQPPYAVFIELGESVHPHAAGRGPVLPASRMPSWRGGRWRSRSRGTRCATASTPS